MNIHETISTLVSQAHELCLKHMPEYSKKVGYCCFFSQNAVEFEDMNLQAQKLGKLAEMTPTGPVYILPPTPTVAGDLRVFKVRKPDPTRPERGDADFTLSDYPAFKASHLHKPGFSLIPRQDYEMIELVDPTFNVRAYFSNPPVESHPGIKEKL